MTVTYGLAGINRDKTTIINFICRISLRYFSEVTINTWKDTVTKIDNIDDVLIEAQKIIDIINNKNIN